MWFLNFTFAQQTPLLIYYPCLFLIYFLSGLGGSFFNSIRTGINKIVFPDLNKFFSQLSFELLLLTSFPSFFSSIFTTDFFSIFSHGIFHFDFHMNSFIMGTTTNHIYMFMFTEGTDMTLCSSVLFNVSP